MTTPERKTQTGEFYGRRILMYEPNEAQLVALMRAADTIEYQTDNLEMVNAVRVVGDVIDALIVESADRHFVLSSLARSSDGDVTPYTDLLLKTFDKMIEDRRAEVAPSNGPAPRKRAARRLR